LPQAPVQKGGVFLSDASKKISFSERLWNESASLPAPQDEILAVHESLET
jgi:hypothetical protein